MCFLYSAPHLAIFIVEIFLKVSTTFPYNALATDQVLMPKQETHFFLPSLYIPLALSDRNNCSWSPQGDCDLRTLLGSSWIYSQPLPSDLVIVVRREINVRGSSVQGEGFWAEESLWVGEHIEVLEGDEPRKYMEALFACFTYLAIWISSIWLLIN